MLLGALEHDVLEDQWQPERVTERLVAQADRQERSPLGQQVGHRLVVAGFMLRHAR